MTQTMVVQMPRWLVWLLAIPALVVAALFGFFVFLAVLGVVAVFAVVVSVRFWWLRRKQRRAPGRGVLEAEYVVVRERQTPRPPE